MSQEQSEGPSDELVEAVADRVIERLDEQQTASTDDYSKREILQGVAILGTTAAVSGVGTYGAIGRASATHGGGSIGTSTDRVDVFAADASVSSAPSSSNDVARKNEVDGKADDPHTNSAHSTDMVEDATTTGNAPYEIQKDGTDGTGVINFKTS